MSGPPLLELADVHAGYGLGHVLQGVTLHVGAGEVVALLGRNGAGKSTTLKAAMGLVGVGRGRVFFEGRDVTGEPPYRRARRGMGYVPQERRIFADLTVLENLEVGRRPDAADSRAAAVLALFPALGPLAGRRGGSLSGGEQQMLALARTLMGQPRLLLLDEPSEGLAPRIVSGLAHQVGQLRAAGLSILLCEQNLRFSLQVSDRVYVLEKGRVQHEGRGDQLAADSATLRRYLAI